MSEPNRFNKALQLAIRFLHQVDRAEEHTEAAGFAEKAMRCVIFCYAWSDELVMHAGQAKCDPERVGLAYVNELLGETDAHTLELIDGEYPANELAAAEPDDIEHALPSPDAFGVVKRLDSFLKARSAAYGCESDAYATQAARAQAARNLDDAWRKLAEALEKQARLAAAEAVREQVEAYYVVMPKGEPPRVFHLPPRRLQEIREDNPEILIAGPFTTAQAAQNHIDHALSK